MRSLNILFLWIKYSGTVYFVSQQMRTAFFGVSFVEALFYYQKTKEKGEWE